LLFNNGPLYEVRLTHTHTQRVAGTHTGTHSQSTGDTHLSWAMQLFNQKTEIKMHSIKILRVREKTFPHFAWQRRQRRRRRRWPRQRRLRRRRRTHTHTLTRRQRKTRDKRRLQFILMPNAEKNQTKRGRLMPLMIMREKHKKQGHTAYTWYGGNRVFGGF